MQEQYFNFGYDQTFHEFVQNKKVVLIGPSPHLVGSKQGQFIEEHDLVVRMNRGFNIPPNMEEDIGKRTDILYNGLTGQEKIHGIIDVDQLIGKIKWICSPNISQGIGLEIENKFLKYLQGRIPFHRIDINLYKSVQNIVHCYLNTGMAALLDLLYYDVREIYITGFTFFRRISEKNGFYYSRYRNPLQYNDPAHNSETQLKYMKKLFLTDRRIGCDEVLYNIIMKKTRKEQLLQQANSLTLQNRREEKRRQYKLLYEKDPSYGKENFGQKIYEKLKKMAITSICDVGCGEGEFCRWSHKHLTRRTFGVDFAQGYHGHGIYWFDDYAHDIRLPDKYVDYVTAFDLMEHLIPADVYFVMEEFKRISKKGVIFYLTYKPMENNIIRDNLHTNLKPRTWWIDRLSPYGHIEEWEDFLILNYETKR